MKRITALLLTVLMLTAALGMTAVPTSATTQESLYKFKIVDGEAYITGSNIRLKDKVYIPDHLAGCPVTRICEYAFRDCILLESVVIPDTVKVIEKMAFFYCYSLKEISIGTGVTEIQDGVFYGCSLLKRINIPDNVKHLGHYIFAFCYALESLTIGKGTETVGAQLACHCPSLKSITVSPYNPKLHSAGNCIIETESKTLLAGCPASTIPADGSVTVIGEGAFAASGIISVMIPDSVTTIGRSAFSECRFLEELTIGDGVTIIADLAFSATDDIKSLTIGAGITDFDRGWFVTINKLEKITVSPKNPRYHSDGNCIIETATKTVVMGCNTSVIPADGSVTVIGARAFSNSGITSVTLPDRITAIGDNAFEFCQKLTSVAMTDSVAKMGKNAFRSCSELEYAVLSENIPELEDNVFLACSNLTYINIPKATRHIAANALMTFHPLTLYYLGTQEEWDDIDKDENYADPELLTLYCEAAPSRHVDLPGDTWYSRFCYWCIDHGLMYGTDKYHFSPDMTLTRAQFVQILAKLAGADLDEVEYKPYFTDVPDGKWYSKAVTWAVEFGVTGGVSPDLYAPDEKVTRAQLVVFLMKYTQILGKYTPHEVNAGDCADFDEIPDWAKEATQWALGEGLIYRVDKDHIAPNIPATRAHTSLIISVFYEKVLGYTD